MVATSRIAGAAVVFGVDRLGENDRSLGAELFHQDVVARWKIDVVSGVATTRGAHVPGIEWVLEGKHDAIHRHRFKVGSPAVSSVKLGGAFKCVGLLAEHLAY